MANEKPNKVIYGGNTLIDLTDSTINPNVLLAGYKAYDASGNVKCNVCGGKGYHKAPTRKSSGRRK